MLADQEREIPADIRKRACEIVGTVARNCNWYGLQMDIEAALLAERERNIDAVRQALQTDYYDWGSLADSLEAAIRDSGREK